MCVASELKADRIIISEPKKRTMLTFVLDMALNRTPLVRPEADEVINKIKNYNQVLFVGPVWFGQVATPFRSYFNLLKTKLGKYAFVSISGGAAGPNPKLGEELTKKIGKKPMAVINPYIADLLPPKPTMKETSDYHINNKEVKELTKTVVKKLREYDFN